MTEAESQGEQMDPIRSESAKELCRAIRAIAQRGWCEGTGGNFSCVLSKEPLTLLMAPSGVDKGTLDTEDLIVVNEQGQVIDGLGRASAETALHQTIVASTGAGAVLHTHSQAGTLLSRHYGPDPWTNRHGIGMVHIEGLEMLKGLEGVSTHESQASIPILANDQDLKRLSSAAKPHLAEAPHGLLIAGHGLYAWGRDLRVAERHLQILEFLLEQRWRELLLKVLTGGTAR